MQSETAKRCCAAALPPALKCVIVAGFLIPSALAGISTTLGTSFYLRVGEVAAVRGTRLEIGFIAVEADSRCGKGSTCIWEGDATVRVWVQPEGGPRNVFELHTAARKPGVVSYGDFSLRLVSLTPFPISGRSIPASAYLVTLRLTRGDDGDLGPRDRAPY